MTVCKDTKGHDRVIHAFVCFCIAAIAGALAAHISPHKEWVAVVVAFLALHIQPVVSGLRVFCVVMNCSPNSKTLLNFAKTKDILLWEA